jgi:phosphoglycerate dehydrogenase-like enzyme
VSPERLLIAEDDAPMRLVALALGTDPDAKLQDSIGQYFEGGAAAGLAQLRAAAEDAGVAGHVVPSVATSDPLEKQVAGVQYLLVEGAAITADVLGAGKDLRLVQKHGEDARNIDLAAAAARGVPVATLERWANTSVAEHGIMLMLAVARRLVEAHQSARASHPGTRGGSRYNWPNLAGHASLRGQTVGIVGMGEIGRAMARRLRPFDVRMVYTQRRRLTAELERGLAVEFRTLPELLAESDIVTLQVPLTAETEHMIDAAALARMRRGAVLINTGRGRLVDEAAVVAALREGQLGGAGLDVRKDEPPASAEGLADHPAVVLTPHVAAGTGKDLLADVREVLANVARVRRGEPALGVLTAAR